MADKDQKENVPIAASPKHATHSVSFQDRLNTATLLTPVGLVNALYGSQVRAAVRDFAVNIVDTVGTVVTFDSEKGDRAADWLKNSWDKVAASQDGQFDFRMSKGWKMPEGMKYNGRLPSDPLYKGPKPGEEIKPLLSIFHRDKRGNIEVLDSDDSHFARIVGPYAITFAGLTATVGTKGVTSLKSAVSLNTGFVAKAGTATYLTLASADLWGGGAQIAKSVSHSMILKPEAIERFAHIIDKADSLTPAQMQKDLNLILEQYAKKEGRNTAQYYIPPLTSPAGAMELLDQMSKGQVKGYERKHAFAEIADNAKKEDIHIGNIREIRDNAYFQRSFLKLATKALQGESMNESERLALRFGMNIVLGNKDGALTVADNKSDFTLHANALKSLRGLLAIPILEAKYEERAKIKEREFRAEDPQATNDYIKERLASDFDIWRSDRRNKSVSNEELLASVGSKLAIVNAQISSKEQEETQKMQVQTMMLAL